MGVTIEKEGALCVIRLTGMLRKAELDAVQWRAASEMAPDANINILVIAESFEGWHRGDPWGDVSFVASHGDRIDKMAFAAEPQWEDRLLMFAGAGLRRTKIKFFPLIQLPEAYAWLNE